MKIIPLLFSLALLVGCASKTPSTLSKTDQCRVEVENARQLIAEERYFPAREELNQTLSNCSGTGFLEEAQFLLAETYFAEKSWLEARGEYSSFVRYYPTSAYAEIAAYRKALSALNMPFVLGRDQSYTDRAIDDFNSFLTDFPSSTKIDSAQIHLNTLIERKAESSYSIARLYFRMEEYQAAAIALKDFLKAYPHSKRIAESREMLLDSYLSLKQFSQAEQWLAFFKSDSVQAYPSSEAEKRTLQIEKEKKRFASARVKEALKTKEIAELEE